MLPKSTKHKNPYAGWSTLNKQDVLQSVSNGLRKYRNNRPVLKLKFRRYPEQDGVTHWKIRSSGKSLCNIYITGTKRSGVKLSYELPENHTKEMRQLLTHDSEQLHEYIKGHIDADNKVGIHWEQTGLPKSVKIRTQWKQAWEEIQEYRHSRRREGYKSKLSDIVDHFKYADDDDTPFFNESTLKKIIRVGKEGKLDDVKS